MTIRKRKLPPIDRADLFCEEYDDTPPEVIEGIVHQGTKAELGGGSKARKTWIQIQIAACVALGIPWLERATHKGKVLYINFELPRWSMRKRVRDVCNALGYDVPSNLHLFNLRGHGGDAKIILPRITQELKSHVFVLIIIDPLYKILGDRDENATKDMADLMLSIEQLAIDSMATVLFGAHFSKGIQSYKEAIDRVSGSGVLSRDPDTIIIMSPHKTPNAFTMDFILRNFPPVDSFAVRQVHPLMEVAPDLDPSHLKQRKNPNQPSFFVETLLEVLAEHGGALTTTEWLNKCKEEEGMKDSTFYKLKKGLKVAKKIYCSQIDKKWKLKP